MILELLAVLLVCCVVLIAWMATSLLQLAHRIGTPRKRPARRYTDRRLPGAR